MPHPSRQGNHAQGGRAPPPDGVGRAQTPEPWRTLGEPAVSL